MGDSHLHSLVRAFCQHFTENPLFIFNKILAFIMYIPPTFPFLFYDETLLLSYLFLLFIFPTLMPLNPTTIINIYKLYLAIEEKKVQASEGVVPPQKPIWCNMGFQLYGIAWREKHWARSARTHEWDPGPPIVYIYIGPWWGPRQSPWQGSKASSPCVTNNILSEVS